LRTQGQRKGMPDDHGQCEDQPNGVEVVSGCLAGGFGKGFRR
jgi:hypothetical protein